MHSQTQSYFVFTLWNKEILVSFSRIIIIPEQQCSSRTDVSSFHSTWSKYTGSLKSLTFFFPLLPRFKQITSQAFFFYPCNAFGFMKSLSQRNCHFSPTLFIQPFCFRFDPFGAVQTGQNQWYSPMWTPYVWKTYEKIKRVLKL